MQAMLSRWSSQMHARPAAPATSASPSLLFVEEAERKGDRNGESLMINIFTAELSLTCSRTHTCLSSGRSFIKF